MLVSEKVDLQARREQRSSCWSEEAVELSEASVGVCLRFQGISRQLCSPVSRKIVMR